MNLDTVATLTLTGEAMLLPVIAIFGSALDRKRRGVAFGVAGVWLALMASLSAVGFFSAAGYGTAFLGVAVALPVMAVAFFRGRSAALRLLIASIPLPLLVVLHVGRLLGWEFLLLQSAGRLPATFARAAGWGDIFVAAASLPLAYAVFRRIRGWRVLTLAWNVAGVTDLIVAVALGAGSAEGSPVRFVYEYPSSALMGTLPWFLIPGYLVPLYLILHTMIFVVLAKGKRAQSMAPSGLAAS
jgi:hypothetical protein